VWRCRRQRGSGSPELGVPSAPVTNPPRLQVREHHLGTGNSSGVNRNDLDDHGYGTTARGGSARRRNDGARVPASGAIYELRHLAQKDQGEEAKLTEGLWRPELRRKGEDDDDRRRKGSGARGKR
jgi:hypothetical protein